MENTKVYDDEKVNKVADFFKRNLYNIMLALATIGFLFKDLLQIEKSNRSIVEIIATASISFAMGMTFNIILSKKGILAGQTTKSYMDMMLTYDKEITRTDSHIDKLDDFCDKKNELRIKKAQIKVLRLQRIKYEDFINKEKEEVCRNKDQEKCWDKAMRVKIRYLTPDNLLSETDDKYERGNKDETLREHERKQVLSTSLTKILFACIFGYFTASFVFDRLSGLLWSILQVAVWLMFGLVAYIQNYFYIREVYQQKIYRKIAYLKEFNMEKEENK